MARGAVSSLRARDRIDAIFGPKYRREINRVATAAATLYPGVEAYPSLMRGHKLRITKLLDQQNRVTMRASYEWTYVQLETYIILQKAVRKLPPIPTKYNIAAEQYALRVAPITATGIASTTAGDIQKAIAQGVLEGLGSDATASLIRTATGGQVAGYRGKMIAQTETGRVWNAVSLENAKDMEELTGPLMKEWENSGDDRVRADHEGVEAVGLNDNFNVAGSQMNAPGDPTAPADQTVNCRCSLTYVPVS